MQIINYGNDYSTFIKLSDQFQEYKFFNPKLPSKYFANTSITPSVISDGFKVNKGKHNYRIFTLGGSTTAGFPHPPNGSFPRILKKLLNHEYPSIDFEVINLGVSAINTYTIRDIINDVLSEGPDLVIIYAGHNEYYGALGPASQVTGFYNSFFTRLILELKEYRTVQLVEDLMRWFIGLFSNDIPVNKTLMSQLAGKKLVPLNSDIYEMGINQFEENLNYILSVCNEKNIPVLIGTLASNLLQEPLCRYAGCDSLYQEFDLIIKDLDSTSSYNHLLRIKEKDELRFRAPEKFNEIIKRSAQNYKNELLEIKSLFENKSPNGIIGESLMMDHLHPNYTGNKIIAELIIDKLRLLGIDETLAGKKRELLPYMIYDKSYKHYSKMDSTFAAMRISYLKNSFPFSNNEGSINMIFSADNISDSIAISVIEGHIGWEDAHLKLAKTFFDRGEYSKFMEEINVLIEDKPLDKYPYLEGLKLLKNVNKPNLTKYILQRYFSVYPELFAARGLADIEFSQSNYLEAIYYYERCLVVNKNDAEIYFNLSSSYFAIKNISGALLNIKKCLELDPNFPNANKIYNGLKNIYNSRKQ